MFSIEHEFDASVIVLMDEGETPLQEDVTVTSLEDSVLLDQLDPRTGAVNRITLSLVQFRDLYAALNLPEGLYRRPEAEGE